jgi:hypothetical protein
MLKSNGKFDKEDKNHLFGKIPLEQIAQVFPAANLMNPF